MRRGAREATRRAGTLLVELYPEAWRGRYRAEICALIDDDPPALRGLGSLLGGALDAHVHPRSAWQAEETAAARMRLSIGAVFCCWIAVSVVGFGFQKSTEEPAFSAAGAHHPLLAVAHGAIIAGAGLGALAIALGGLQLLWEALRQAHSRRDWRLAALLALAPGAIGCYLSVTLLLLAVAPAGGGHSAWRLTVVTLWQLGGGACATICALASRAVLRRIAPSPQALRRAALASTPLSVAMALIAVALLTYAVALPLQSPRLSALGDGPLAVSTGVVLTMCGLLAAIASSLALLGAARARQAASHAA